MREQLIRLLNRYFDIGDSYTYNLTRDKAGFAVGTVDLDDFEEYTEDNVADLADHLIENGVILPPVKVGQTVYRIINNTKACRDCKHFSSFYGMDEMCDKWNDIVMNPRVSDKTLCEKQFYEIKEYKPDIDWIFSHRERFGKTVFLTREAAEEALKARENNVR